MKDSIESFEVIRSGCRKKTMALQITREGNVVIRVPLKTPDSEVERFFFSRQAWIARKRYEKEMREERESKPREFMTGEEFLYLGTPYPLEMTESNGSRISLILARGKFMLARKKASQAKELFIKWYRERAREVIEERVCFWGTRFGLIPTGITITGARQRYGSCSAKNRLSFSWRLILAPCQVIDYIVIHELAHIKVKNHSRKFWIYLERLMPEYRTRRQWLNENGHLLRL